MKSTKMPVMQTCGKSRPLVLAVAALFLPIVAWGAHDGSFWVSARTRGLNDDADMLFASNIIVRAAQSGIRNVLWPGGLDTYWQWPAARKARFLEVKRIADANGMRIVPSVWSIGYATMIGVDPGLIESKPLTNLPYVAKGGRLVPDKDLGDLVENGGLEKAGGSGSPFAGWDFDDGGKVAFIDRSTAHSGNASVRVEPVKEHSRLKQKIVVKPNRLYRATVWFKAENLPAASGCLRLQVRIAKDAKLGIAGPETVVEKHVIHYDSTQNQGWFSISLDFASGASTVVNLRCGSWNERSGTFWMDDISVTETGPREIARRADSPRTVRSAVTGKAYEQGKDWLNPDFGKIASGEEITFPLPAGSAIRNGEKVLVDTYVPSRAGPKMQISTCMSDPRLYELFRKSAATIEELLHPDRWYLSLDEVRNGGTCPLCAARKTDMAHIFADCVMRQHEIIRSVHPGADIYMPSDMVDPLHNAKPGRYYGCNGTFHGVWELIPRDIIISLWWDKVIDRSVPFFTGQGFKVMGSISVGAGSLDKLKKWKETFDACPDAMGFRYTTWSMNYDRFDEFVKALK